MGRPKKGKKTDAPTFSLANDSNNEGREDSSHGDSTAGNSTQPEAETWSEARDALVEELKKDTSDIHLIFTAKATQKAKAEMIWNKYAPTHDKEKSIRSIINLIRDFKKKRGHFDPSKQVAKPVWKNKKETSTSWFLLYKLRLHKGTNGGRLSAEDIYKHHPIFQQYDLTDFKKWDKEMIKLTDKHRKRLEENVEMFYRHRQIHPMKTISARGKRIWNNHPAKIQLIEDTRSGKASNTKPMELWKSFEPYQDFSLEDFQKHIYQEQYRQIAGPYWQKKHNKAAQKKHKEEVERLYQEWNDAKWKGEEGIIIGGIERLAIN